MGVSIHGDRPFRFEVINEAIVAPGEWIDHVRRVESCGYDTFLIRDHLVPDFFGPQLAPLPALMAAASVTTRLRVGTMVLDNDFRHPAMLAKEIATIDALSGGRFELGIGAGWLRGEYDKAGIPYDRAGVRIDRLEESLHILRGLLSGESLMFRGDHYAIDGLDTYPKPTQHPHPPILIGAGQRRMLTLAGREADIVGILTTSVASGTLSDDPTERLAASVEQKLAWVKDGAGDRFSAIELSLIPTIEIATDREARAAEMIRERGWDATSPTVTVVDVLEMPSVFIGTVEEIASQMLERRERYGFSYYVFSDTRMEELTSLVQCVRHREGSLAPLSGAALPTDMTRPHPAARSGG